MATARWRPYASNGHNAARTVRIGWSRRRLGRLIPPSLRDHALRNSSETIIPIPSTWLSQDGGTDRFGTGDRLDSLGNPRCLVTHLNSETTETCGEAVSPFGRSAADEYAGDGQRRDRVHHGPG